MKNKQTSAFKVGGLSLAIASILGASALPFSAIAQESEDEVIEEVVATGTRLKGTATAVLQERQNQAFVADILGAEQISRTGDSDAAAALRRVTGLTLVDGKFFPTSTTTHAELLIKEGINHEISRCKLARCRILITFTSIVLEQ